MLFNNTEVRSTFISENKKEILTPLMRKLNFFYRLCH